MTTPIIHFRQELLNNKYMSRFSSPRKVCSRNSSSSCAYAPIHLAAKGLPQEMLLEPMPQFISPPQACLRNKFLDLCHGLEQDLKITHENKVTVFT